MNIPNNNLLNLYEVILNESKQEWICYITTNRLLQIWTRPVPLVKLHGDVNSVLARLYQSHCDLEVYSVLQFWDTLSSHQEDTFGDINVEVSEWIDLMNQTPIECFTLNFTEPVASLLINSLLVCLSGGIEV